MAGGELEAAKDGRIVYAYGRGRSRIAIYIGNVWVACMMRCIYRKHVWVADSNLCSPSPVHGLVSSGPSQPPILFVFVFFVFVFVFVLVFVFVFVFVF